MKQGCLWISNRKDWYIKVLVLRMLEENVEHKFGIIALINAGTLSPRNGLGVEAKNYGLGLGLGLGHGLIDAVASASSCVDSWPRCSLEKHFFMFRF